MIDLYITAWTIVHFQSWNILQIISCLLSILLIRAAQKYWSTTISHVWLWMCVHMYLLPLSMPPLLLSAELLHLFIAPPLLSLLLFSELSLPSLLLWDYKHKFSLTKLPFLYINLSADSNFRPRFTLTYAVPFFTTRWRCKGQCIWSTQPCWMVFPQQGLLTGAVLKRGGLTVDQREIDVLNERLTPSRATWFIPTGSLLTPLLRKPYIT